MIFLILLSKSLLFKQVHSLILKIILVLANLHQIATMSLRVLWRIYRGAKQGVENIVEWFRYSKLVLSHWNFQIWTLKNWAHFALWAQLKGASFITITLFRDKKSKRACILKILNCGRQYITKYYFLISLPHYICCPSVPASSNKHTRQLELIDGRYWFLRLRKHVPCC